MVTLQQYVIFCCATKWISYMYTYIPSLLDLPSTLHPTPLGDYRAWSWASCAIQQLPTSCLFYTWWCICVSPNLPIHLISYLLLPYLQVYSVCAWDFNSHQDFGLCNHGNYDKEHWREDRFKDKRHECVQEYWIWGVFNASNWKY